MNKLRNIVYMILDQLKGFSDDFSYTEDHIVYLLNNYRALLLKQKYSDIKKQVPKSNYQTICLDLISEDIMCGMEGYYLKSTKPIPDKMLIGNTELFTCNFYIGDVSYIPYERFKYSGNSRFHNNLIYGTISPDNHIYLKSNNPQLVYLENIQISAIFEDIIGETELGESCNILDIEFPLETALLPLAIQAIIKELSGVVLKPVDSNNNAHDDMGEFVKNNKPQQNGG